MEIEKQLLNPVRNLKQTKVISTCAMLGALNVVINLLRFKPTPTFEVNFAYLAIAIGGFLYGWAPAVLVAIVGDIIGFITSPNGFFFPGFTLNKIVIGLIFGLVLYNKKVNLKSVTISIILKTVLITFILTPIWLSIMYPNNQIIYYERIIKGLIEFPIHVIATYYVLKTVEKVKK
ncbi:MAG: folate family ECF transporter S component [Tissierellia bacterium]|nr:folate family ECF transporter S component [Tissierellia bacterium]